MFHCSVDQRYAIRCKHHVNVHDVPSYAHSVILTVLVNIVRQECALWSKIAEVRIWLLY